MEKTVYTVRSNRRIAKDVYEMKLRGSVRDFTAPGQFLNLAIDGLYLRRPISVCRIERDADGSGNGLVTILYKVVGRGTEAMALLPESAALSVLTGLGNGFSTEEVRETALVIGGGIGVPPLYGTAEKLLAEGKKVIAILGFNGEEEIFYEKEFRDLGAEVMITTADGSRGIRGFVTEAIRRLREDGVPFDYTFACGPEPMLKAVYGASGVPGQYSFEQRMGCGFGACMGCSCKTKDGFKRICREGPVLRKEEILWQ